MKATGGREKILVIEDDEGIRNTVQELLESERYTVVTAEDGQQGLEALEAHVDVGLIIVDWMMPRMNGEQFVHQLKADAAHPFARIPIVVLTASSHGADVLRKQVEGFITKPFELNLFLKTVRHHLRA